MSQTVSMLPDDDEPLPRHRPAIDEVNAVHAAAGEYLAPLGPRTTSTASFGSNSGLPPPPMSGMPASMPSGMGIPTPMGGMPAPMTGGGMPPPIMNTTVIDNSGNGNVGAAMMNQQTMQMNGMAATAQAQASVGVAQTSLDKELLDDQLKKEDEHWVKSYWRPAAGWLYMLICFMDFIGFPLISMFLPLVFKKDGIIANYVPWQSLTLSNGGLIHLAFGAILGIAAFSRGQEKLAAMR